MPNNILLSTTTNDCLRENGPSGSAERGHDLVAVPASSLERHSGGATTTSSDQNVCLLVPMNSMEERHSGGATTIWSAQNECLLAPMSSMIETRLATTPSAEGRPVSMEEAQMATPDSTHESHLSQLSVGHWPW